MFMSLLFHRRSRQRKSANRLSVSLLAGVVISMLLLSACGGNSSSAAASRPIKIGVSLSLSGDNSADGKSTQQGYDVWAETLNTSGGLLGHQVQMVYYDDGTKVDQTRTNYEKLISVDHVNFVIGPFGQAFTITGAEVASRFGYAFPEGIATAPDTFTHGLNNLFVVSLSIRKYLQSFVYYVLALPAAERPKTVAYVTSDDPGTQPAIDSARPLLEAGGLTTVLSTVYPAETTDYTPIAQKVVAAHPDVVILGSTGVGDSAPFFRAFIQQHFNPKLIIATAGPDQGRAFTSVIGPKNTEGVLVPNDGWWPAAKTFQNAPFVKAFVATYGGTPDDIGSDAVQAFSVGQVLQQAVNKAQSLDNAKVMHALRSGTFQSVQGLVTFSPSGENIADVAFLFQWQGGKLIPVFPNDQAQANVEYPKPAWATGS